MAIYHFSTQAISRGQGRSAVACAAYRSGENLRDVRQDKTHDYRQKEDVAHTAILLPEQAPEWMQDRETLWNHIEAIEIRKDARLAREIQFSLPRELTLEQNIALAREFVQTTFVDKGMVADMAVHVDHTKAGEEQPHVHLMLATRNVSEAGFGLKNTDWNKKETLLAWREAWANLANRHLAFHGHDICIDHRSYADQGIELEPQHKIGASVVKEQLARLADHQRIARENGERIYQNPNIALDAITHQQSTFTPQDLARFIHRHTDNAEQFQRVLDKVKLSPELVKLGRDLQGRERLTTAHMLDIESNLLATSKTLNARSGHAVAAIAIERASAKRTLSPEQLTALHYLADKGDLKSLVGYAGTGKSYLLGAAREAWAESGYRVQGIALSGIAAQNLEQGAGIPSRTVASFLARLERGIDTLSAKDVVIIDEAGMLGSRQTESLLRALEASGAKVILCGDGQQLQAIEAGGAFRAITESTGFIELTDIRRQQVPWQREATLALAKGDVEAALAQYREHDHVHTFDTQGEAKARLIEQWNDARLANPQESQLIMAYTRKDVTELNELARSLLKRDGQLGQDCTFEMERGTRQFAAGERIYFLKRDDGLRVVNGTLGTIKAMDEKTGQLQVELDRDDLNPSERVVSVDTKQYKDLEHGYAATVYKAQGVTVDRAYMLTSKHYDAHSTYVGMSRHRHSCEVFVSREEFNHERAVNTCLGRDRTKDVTLDYTQPAGEFARQRAIGGGNAPVQVTQQPERATHPATLERGKPIDIISPKQAALQASLAAFRAEFQQANSQMAQHLDGLTQSPQEKQAQALVAQFKQHSEGLAAHRLSPQDKARFEQQTAEMAKQPLLMQHLKHAHPELALKVEQLAKEQEQLRKRIQEQSQGRGLSR